MFRYYNIVKGLSSSSLGSPLLKFPLTPSTTTSSLRLLCSSSTSDSDNDEQEQCPTGRLEDIARSGYIDLASAIARNTFFSLRNTQPKSFYNAALDSMCKAGCYRDFFSHYRIFFNNGFNYVPDLESKQLLIRVYCESGRVEDALDVFYHLSDHGNIFWVKLETYDVLSKAVANSGKFAEAEHLLQKIKDSHHLSHQLSVVYSNIISGFLRVGDLDSALQYCDRLRVDCPEDEGIVYANLMDWYLKNDSEGEAMKLYRELLDRVEGYYNHIKLTPEMCNSFLECLIKHGKTEQVSVLFENMLKKKKKKKKNSHRFVINSKTYYIMVNHYLNLGKNSEAWMMIKENYGRYREPACQLNNIIEKLCENGLVHEAEKLVMKKLKKEPVYHDLKLFDRQAETDFVTCQILIEVYLKEAEDEKKVYRVDDALELFEKMVFQMKLIPGRGFCEKLFNQLINKWGRIDQVADFVERMGARERDVKPDPTCYEIVMTGLLDAGKLETVEVLLDQMVNNFTVPTFPDSSKDPMILEKRVKDLARSGYHDLVAAITRDTFFSRKYTPVSICNIILDLMCSAGRYNNFFSYFRFFFSGARVVPNSESYYHLIRVYCDIGCIDDAVDVYNFNPGRASQVYLSKALVNSDRFEEAEGLLYKNLPHSNTSGGQKSAVYCNLISGHLRHSCEDDDHWWKAVGYVDQLWRRVPSYEGAGAAIFMDWYLSKGFKTHAMDHYRDMMNDPKTRPMIPETGNAFLKCLTKHGESLEASKLFGYMSTKSSLINSDSFNIMVNHYFELGKFSEAMDVFEKIPYAMHDLLCFNNFIEKLCENGLVSEARKLLLEEMPKKKVAPDFATYQILIDSYLKPRKKATTAIELFKKMVFEAKLIPHKGFCERFFDQLIKKGKIEEVSNVIEKMGTLGRDVIPEPICYKIVIKGLIASGKLDKVKVLLNQMAISFSAPTFLANRSINKDVPQSLAGESWCDLKDIIYCKCTTTYWLGSEEEES